MPISNLYSAARTERAKKNFSTQTLWEPHMEAPMMASVVVRRPTADNIDALAKKFAAEGVCKLDPQLRADLIAACRMVERTDFAERFFPNTS